MPPELFNQRGAVEAQETSSAIAIPTGTLERAQYEGWQQASLGYMTQALRAYESNPVWTSDPKITPYRDGGRVMLYNGYAGKVGAASAACSADLVIPNMVAEAASGQSTPRDAATRAEQRARRYYKT